MRTDTVPGRSLPMMRRSMGDAGIMPPAVVQAKISSAARNSATGIGRTAQGMPRSAQSSITEARVIPSSAPRSGVATCPLVTEKMLKPAPSVTLPSASSRIAKSAPASNASNCASVRSPQ